MMKWLALFALSLVTFDARPADAQAIQADVPIMDAVEVTPVCPGNTYWAPIENYGCIAKPPTPSQRECIERWSERDDLVNVLDVASTGAALAMGATEIGLAGIAGPAAPIMLIALKLLSRESRDASIEYAYRSGDYDAVCAALKARNGLTGAAVVNNAIVIGGM